MSSSSSIAVARPLEVAQRFPRDEQNARTEPMAFTDEVVALEVAGQTEDRDGRSGHVRCGRRAEVSSRL